MDDESGESMEPMEEVPLSYDVLYNFYSELTGTGGASVCM